MLFESLGPELEFVAGRWSDEAKFAKGVVIIAPTAFSLFTISVLEFCVRLGVPVAAIVIKRFSLARFREEWDRDGWIVLKKIWRKIILRSDENAERSDMSLKDVYQSLRTDYIDARNRASKLGIPVLEVDRFDSVPPGLPRTASVALFTGGGLTGKAFLSAFADGVINIHHGHLPQFKGMDVVHAPVLEKRLDRVGMTAHFMSPGLDEGPVLERCSIDPRGYVGIHSLRNSVCALMPILAVDAMLGFFSGRLRPIAQSRDGRQYYLNHSRINDVLNSFMAQNEERGDPRLRRDLDSFIASVGSLSAHPGE